MFVIGKYFLKILYAEIFNLTGSGTSISFKSPVLFLKLKTAKPLKIAKFSTSQDDYTNQMFQLRQAYRTFV